MHLLTNIGNRYAAPICRRLSFLDFSLHNMIMLFYGLFGGSFLKSGGTFQKNGGSFKKSGGNFQKSGGTTTLVSTTSTRKDCPKLGQPLSFIYALLRSFVPTR